MEQRIIKPQIEVEELVNNPNTQESFDNAILKAKMLYEEVVASKINQFGYAANNKSGNAKNASQGKDIILIYTSSKDSKVHLVPVEYSRISYQAKPKWSPSKNEYAYCSFLKEGYYVIRGIKENKQGGRKGVIAHNGREVVKPYFKTIKNINDTVVDCELSSYHNFYDYNGVLRYRTIGETGVLHGEYTLEGEPAAFVYTRHRDKITVILVWKGQMYKIIEERHYKYQVNFELGKFTYYTIEGRHSLEKSQILELAKKNGPIPIGTGKDLQRYNIRKT